MNNEIIKSDPTIFEYKIQIPEDVLLELDAQSKKLESMIYQLIEEKLKKQGLTQADIEMQRLEFEKRKDALRKQQEQEKLDNDIKFGKFISKHNFDKVESVNGKIILWKKIATLN